MSHRFGGHWTELKLDAVQYYLECYTKALTARHLDIWYIDAFAGSGDREEDRQVGGLIDGHPLETVKVILDGSARRALKVQPPFKHFVLIEDDEDRCQALRRMKAELPSADIQVIRGDANQELSRIVRNPPWTLRSRTTSRGVVFLDPYALQVDWSTLCALAETELLDVWYLFPLRDVTRQLAHDFKGIGPKEPKLDAILGPEWKELYSEEDDPSDAPCLFDLLGDAIEPKRTREATVREIEAWFKKRLRSQFAYVSDPLPIVQNQGRQAFSLFLCVSNPNRAAVDLARHFAGYVKKKYG